MPSAHKLEQTGAVRAIVEQLLRRKYMHMGRVLWYFDT